MFLTTPGETGRRTPTNALSRAVTPRDGPIRASELEDEGVLVSSACPAVVATQTSGTAGATKPIEDCAAGIVGLAALMDERPTGGVFDNGRTVAL